MNRVPVLWLCGPAGVGKSTVSWQLFTELTAAGVRAAFADTDQFCMCYPAPAGDPGRQHLKALNVGSVIPSLAMSGAQCLIANGVLDAAGLRTELLPAADVTICRLRARGEEVERRFAVRHSPYDEGDLAGMRQQTRDEVLVMDRSSFADATVDTTGVPAAEVAAAVRAACPDWPGFAGDLPEPPNRPDAPDVAACSQDQDHRPVGGQVLLITGPTGVGKSTIGFPCYLSCLGAGVTAGYLDLDQLGFLRPGDPRDPGNHRLKARNLGTIWRNYRDAGATHLVAVGPMSTEADVRLYAEALPGASVTLVRLRAEPDDLRQRIASRGAGGSWPQPGDPLAGQSPEFLAAVAAETIRDGHALDRSGLGALTVDTTGLAVAESAALLCSAAGWPA